MGSAVLSKLCYRDIGIIYIIYSSTQIIVSSSVHAPYNSVTPEQRGHVKGLQ